MSLNGAKKEQKEKGEERPSDREIKKQLQPVLDGYA